MLMYVCFTEEKSFVRLNFTLSFLKRVKDVGIWYVTTHRHLLIRNIICLDLHLKLSLIHAFKNSVDLRHCFQCICFLPFLLLFIIYCMLCW